MKFTRLYSDDQGNSQFQDSEVALVDAGDIGRLSKAVPTRTIVFRETGGDYDYDFHNAPDRQFIIMLDGRIEIETSTGARREFAAGDILFAEDTNGTGHRTRSLDGAVRRSIFVTVPEDYTP